MGGKSNEGHESHEGEEGLRTAGQASCLCWEIHEDAKWTQEDRLGEEQVWQDCKQEDASPRQGQPVDRRGEGSTVSIEDQGLLRDQEGFPALQQGKGTLQKEVIRWPPDSAPEHMVPALWTTHGAVEPRAWQ